MSTTMVESYDTQMLDYSNDLDVPMHVSSDPWFQDEADMEDDGLSFRISEHENINNSVEVDMEPYDDDSGIANVEFDMVDGNENFGSNNEELVDIEVYDAAAVVAEEGSSHTTNYSSHLAPILVESPLPDINSVPLSLQPETEPTDISLYSDTDAIVAISQLQQRPDTSAAHENEEISQERNILLREEKSTTVQEVDARGTTINVEPSEQSPEMPQSLSVDEEDIKAPVSLEPAPNIIPNNSTEIPVVETSDVEFGAQHGDVDRDPPVPAHNIAGPDIADPSGDPHEISEGVYIDPPPAVLLSFSSADSFEICLFNEPSNSNVASPSEGSPQQEHQSFTVLLQNRPTLYYEPLASVFEALRQEEYISTISEFAEGELVLNAYDLQLVISEDSIYTREITLHDLNVLHDGSNISGPLRIRIQTIVPRFIVRYHLLQEQINQLNLMHLVEVVEEQYNNEDDLHPAVVGNENELEQNIPHESIELEENVESERTVHDRSEDFPSLPAEDTFHGESDLHLSPVQEEEDSSASAAAVNSNHDVIDSEYDSDEASHTEEAEDPHDNKEQGNATPLGHEVDELELDGLKEFEYRPEIHEGRNDADAATPRPEQTEETIHESDLTDSPSNKVSEPANNLIVQQESEQDDTEVQYIKNESESAIVDSITSEPKNTDGTLPESSCEGISNLEHDAYDITAWDDSLDGEGDPDISDAELEIASNESSITLSSKTSSKRNIDETGIDEEDSNEPESPEPKRSRVK